MLETFLLVGWTYASTLVGGQLCRPYDLCYIISRRDAEASHIYIPINFLEIASFMKGNVPRVRHLSI